MFFTNSYAITRQGYRRLAGPDRRRAVQSHDAAGALFLDGRPGNVLIPAAYGFTSKTMASLTSLRHFRRLRGVNLAAVLRARMRQGGTPMALPGACGWAQKWSDQVAALHREAAGD
jgi:hypothetical protein